MVVERLSRQPLLPFNQHDLESLPKPVNRAYPGLDVSVNYVPLWQEEHFGGEMSEKGPSAMQLDWENSEAIKYGLLHTPDAIKLALHINRENVASERRLIHSWYPYKTCTHPAFVLNFLRFSLRNKLFNDLEEAMVYLDSDRSNLRVDEVLKPSEKFAPTPEALPRGDPIALAHGRFLGIPHPDHEKAVMALASLKEENPSLLVVVAIDQFGLDKGFANNAFRASLLASIPEVDYVTIIDFPEEVRERNDFLFYKTPEGTMYLEEADAFYEEYYMRIFSGRDGSFLYVNPYYNEELKSKLIQRCEKVGVKPVGRAGGIVWSSSILYGFGDLPEGTVNPFDSDSIVAIAGKGRYNDDPEEALELYWDWLAHHIAETYASAKELRENFPEDAFFGGLRNRNLYL